jgi:hypothetical protein
VKSRIERSRIVMSRIAMSGIVRSRIAISRIVKSRIVKSRIVTHCTTFFACGVEECGLLFYPLPKNTFLSNSSLRVVFKNLH